ncbi:MAG: CinA family protein, partial [Burkholderiales bacterium]|nr:CinA family protein [Opitutaceae bacterium]
MDTDKDRINWSEEESRALHGRLLALGVKVAVAESLTVGRVQAELGRVSGASGYFAGGVTCYATEAKVRLLGVDAAHAAEVNAVSARVAEEMARGAAKLFGCEIAVATTGYAEPDAARGVAEPFAWVAVVRREYLVAAHHRHPRKGLCHAARRVRLCVAGRRNRDLAAKELRRTARH